MYNSIYPNYVNSYYGANNRKIAVKPDDKKNSQTSEKAENDLKEHNHPKQDNGMYFPNGEKTAIDYTRRQINIDQVLKDFKNTAKAIGVPDEINAEVSAYLDLAQTQSQRDIPNAQVIQSNLKTASKILDEYITNTLKKPSKVVENWVDTLFLQDVDYKTSQPKQLEAQPTQPQTQEVIEEPKEEPISAPSTEQNNQPEFYIPSDAQLKNMFIQAKKYAQNNEKEQALYSFQKVMEYARELGDEQACTLISYEQGRLYEDFDSLEDALYNYNIAAKHSKDNNIKAKAHMSMARIYDDFINFKPAHDHYCAAASFAGEADNLKLQTKVFADIAQIHTDRYEKDDAIMFMSLADIVADETQDEKVKGIIYSRNAKNCKRLNDKARALRLYGNSASAFSKTEDYENLAKNYRDAAEIMIQYGNRAKARTLLNKAYSAVQKTFNQDLQKEITKKIADL